MGQLGTPAVDRSGEFEGPDAHVRLLARGLDPAEILGSRQILHMMELPEVPRNTLLIKGVLESEAKPILLMDTRVNLTASNPYRTDRACAIVVDMGGTAVGLILDGAPEA